MEYHFISVVIIPNLSNSNIYETNLFLGVWTTSCQVGGYNLQTPSVNMSGVGHAVALVAELYHLFALNSL